MTAAPDPDSSRPPDEDPDNLVRLRGRVSTAPEERRLPSGSLVVSLRLSVPRRPAPMPQGSRQGSDWVDCSAWGGKARRTVGTWQMGDVVEVEGALRRRFSRPASGPVTRLEVEVLGARRLRRPEPPGRRPPRAVEAGAPGDS